MERIGRYELRDKLGQGGMGVVYRAFDTLLHRVVAVKIISATIDGNPDLRERFFREARAAGQLSHPNIITIHDLGEENGVPYLAMEYLEGEDLQRRMSGHDKMSLSHKLDLAIEICEGLQFAHNHAVIHRDIKPANIFITDDGTVKLLDFGLARLVTSELTHSNMMMGTLNYMAPEQVRGERADHRADIFATGVVLYELLSGRKAFQGDSFAATLYKILQEVPEPLDQIEPTLPWQMIAIVERALAKPRDERYQLMSEMLHDLLAVRQQEQFADAPTGYRWTAPGPMSPPPVSLPGSGPQRPSSDSMRPPSGPRRPQSGGGFTSRPDLDVTGVPSPPPTPLLTSSPTTGTTPYPAPAAPRTSRGLLMAAIVAALLLAGALAYNMFWRTTPPPAQTQTPTAPGPAAPTATTPAIQDAMAQALAAYQTGNYANAERLADGVLVQVPNHPEARRIRDEARGAVATIDRGLRDARAAFQAGRYVDAAIAAGSVLSVDPKNEEAKRLMDESSSRSRGRALDEARTRMGQAKAGAIAASAPSLAAGAYGVAIAAEREATRLQRVGRVSEAASKYYEAAGLFRSAEVAAQTALPPPSQRAQAERTPPQATAPGPTTTTPPPTPQPAPPVVNTPPVTTPERLPGGTALPAPSAPVAPPVAPPPPAATQPAPSPAPAESAAASAEAAIRDVLGKYEAALEARSLDALRKIWPTMSNNQRALIRQEFEQARRIEVDIVEPHIAVAGTTATVLFVRHYEFQPVGGQPQRADTPTTMTLRRVDGAWVIESIRFAPSR
jgi:serine/threonine-protein kinase